MHPMLNMAVRAAHRAGDLILRYLDRVGDLDVQSKGHNDFVSEVDRAAEATIIEVLRRAYPDHVFIGEEGGEQAGENEDYQWLIDPLDGTTNFLHGHPQFAVSIALRVKGRLEQGVVYDPARQETFTASRGAGAYLNDRRLRVSRRTGLKGALIGTGFPVRQPAHLDLYLETFRAIMLETAGVRRAGAAALDLAWVAAGRMDGFWEFVLQPWDIAAGALLIEEAGGIVTDLDGGTAHMERGHVVAGNPKVIRELLKLLRGTATRLDAIGKRGS
ncbi:MAG TPA: inositol monophosphatase [Gammaproteobacteria bacterium]|nr:inositol monophosphatase [Gammaproteobacteria bacterium]